MTPLGEPRADFIRRLLRGEFERSVSGQWRVLVVVVDTVVD
jgi:hypothetical protein